MLSVDPIACVTSLLNITLDLRGLWFLYWCTSFLQLIWVFIGITVIHVNTIMGTIIAGQYLKNLSL